MRGLYRYTMDSEKMGDVEGIFVSTDRAIEKQMGKEVYFGEILGKHSEISGTLHPYQITMLTSDQKAVEIVEKYNLETGYNPLDYIQE